MSMWVDKRYVHVDAPVLTEQERLQKRIDSDMKGPFDERHLRISFCLERGLMNIGRDVIRQLSYPDYIALLQDDAACQVAIVVGDPEDTQAFRVPKGFPEDGRTMFRINSIAYVEEMLEMHRRSRFYDSTGRIAGTKERTLSFDGIYNEKHHAVIFQL